MANIFIKIFPGSSILEHILREQSEAELKDFRNVVLISIDEGWVIGFIIEEANKDGLIMVFVPGAPIPTSGTLYMMTEDKIKRVNIPVHKALLLIWNLGRNSEKIVAGKLNL